MCSPTLDRGMVISLSTVMLLGWTRLQSSHRLNPRRLATERRDGIHELLIFGRMRTGGRQRGLPVSLGGETGSSHVGHPYLYRP